MDLKQAWIRDCEIALCKSSDLIDTSTAKFMATVLWTEHLDDPSRVAYREINLHNTVKRLHGRVPEPTVRHISER